MKPYAHLLSLLCLLFLLPTFAQDKAATALQAPIPEPPAVDGTAHLLVDHHTGKLIAEMVRGQSPFMDISRMSLDRFGLNPAAHTPETASA